MITLRLFFFFFLFKSISGADGCLPASCSPTEPQVRFPFRISGRQPSHCGFPGFDLSCNEQNQTILHLTSSASYIVNKISYKAQTINIDPELCLPKQIREFRLTGTPFNFGSIQSYNLFNCSLQKSEYVFPVVQLSCLDSVNHSVIAVPTGLILKGKTPENCRDIGLISVPIRSDGNISEQLELQWFTPYCRPCELQGGICRLENVNGDTTCFFPMHRFTRGPLTVFLACFGGLSILIIFVICCPWKGKYESDYTHQNLDTPLPITISPRPQSATGLEASTFRELYNYGV